MGEIGRREVEEYLKQNRLHLTYFVLKFELKKSKLVEMCYQGQYEELSGIISSSVVEKEDREMVQANILKFKLFE